MRKVLNKWYMSMFFIPILITYLTSYVQFPVVFSNWEYSIIASLIILVGILTYELKTTLKELRETCRKPDKHDRKIIHDLLEMLNLDDFHEDIYRQDAWHGYKKDVINQTLEFKENVRLIKNKTSDDQLNYLLYGFTLELEHFLEYSSYRLFDGDNFYIPNKDTKQAKEKSKHHSEKMNSMTKECFDKLEVLMNYLRTRKYL